MLIDFSTIGHYYRVMQDVERHYQQFIQDRRKDNLLRELTDIERPTSRLIKSHNQEYINFSSNDYLGLSKHPELIENAQKWAQEYGVGCGASRLVTGNIDIFSKLENDIAQFKNKEAAIVMASGFQANASVLPALFDKDALNGEPLVFTDKLNHASMHLGCAAAKIKQIRYRHNDMAHLEELLVNNKDSNQQKFILTESVFSMDGDIAPLDEIDILAKKHNCFTIVDEAHSTGVMGKQGQGIALKADLVIGTFSKAFGSFGAYVACSKILKEYLTNKCSGLIYATALPPTVLGSIDAALKLIPAMNNERAHTMALAELFRNYCAQCGFDTGNSKTNIVPIIIGDSNEALQLSKHLKKNNIWTSAIRPPTVPKDSARLRFTFTAAHTHEDLNVLIKALNTNLERKAA